MPSAPGSLRVIYDPAIFEEQRYGGVSKYIVRLADQLARDGLAETRIVAPLHVNFYLRGDAAYRLTGLRVPPDIRAGPLIKAVNRLVFPAVARRHRPDIVHETYYRRTAARAGARGVVVTVHDMIHEKFPELCPPGDDSAALKAAAVARADHIICISQSTRRDFLERFPHAEARTSVVLHGADLVPSPPGRGRGTGDRPYLLHVGPRGGYKNFDALLAALALGSRDFDLVAAGGGGFSDAERQRIAALGLAGRVRQLRPSDPDLQRLYRDAALFVYPSLYEGFGIPPLEAMAAGCPVVCVASSSLPEVCGDAAEFAADGSPDALAHAIDRVLESPQRRDTLIAAGQRNIARFSWGTCARASCEVYRSLA